jgi:hypothetical protein
LDSIAKPLAQLRSKSLLCADRLATTPTGYAFLNDVLAQFLPAPDHTTDRIPVQSKQ